MHLPSFNNLISGAKHTFYRFPFVILTSLTGAVIMAYIINLPYPESLNVRYLYNIVMACSLGIPFLISLSFITERLKSSRFTSLLIQTTGLILLVTYYFSLPAETSYIDITRYIVLVIALHLLVSFSPFIIGIFDSSGVHTFWQFNQLLFIRILITGVYSGVLYAGLCIAILSFDKLFNININEKIYGQLFFIILGFFSTWFFLSDMPSETEAPDTGSPYPKGLKIFTQYVLLPLVIIYLLILYLYTGKIILQWQLPMGWVSYLILGFSVTGIFSLLLIHPLRNIEGNTWMRNFRKWFYITLFPLIILLFISILRRTNEYGITERRYFVFILAVWLAGIALYFTLSKAKNIKFIPFSLCVIAFLSCFGPWSAYSISEKSQLNRLENVLSKNNIIEDGKIKKIRNTVTDDDRREISSEVIFFCERKSLGIIQPWFDIDLESIKDTVINNVRRKKEAMIVEYMGVEFFPQWTYQVDKYFNYTLRDYDSFILKDYDYLLIYKYAMNDTAKNHYVKISDSISFEINKNNENNIIEIRQKDKPAMSIDLNLFIEGLKKSNSPSPALKDMTIEVQNENLKLKFVIISMNGEKDLDKLKINYINGYIFVKLNLIK